MFFVSFLDRRTEISRSLETRSNLRSATCVHRYIDVVVLLTLSYYSLLSSTFASTLAEHCSRMTSSTVTYGTCIHVYAWHVSKCGDGASIASST